MQSSADLVNVPAQAPPPDPVEPEVRDAALAAGVGARDLLEQTAFEWDGRGVTLVGVVLPLPPASGDATPLRLV